MFGYQDDMDMFQSALGIQSPWFVSYREFDQVAGELHVHLNFKRGATFPCPECHAPCKVHDVVNDDRTWRHLNFFQYKTFIRAHPRVNCKSCGKILAVKVDWARPQAGFTFQFDAHAMSLMKEMPVAAVAREIKEHDTRLWRVFHYYVDRAMNEMDFSKVKRIAVDETSSKRGHNYVTLFVDMDTKRVMFATEGKGANVLLVLKKHLEEKELDPSQIEEFCCDMSPAFISGIEDNFPKAHITFDKFHVIKMVNEAVDQVRKDEQKEGPALKKRNISG